MRSQADPNRKTLLSKGLPQRLPLRSDQDILNWCFLGYVEFCFSRIYWARMDAECLSCQAPVAAGLERPPPSGDRWLRPVDSNRLLPSRYLAPGAAGLDDSKPGRLDRCKASVAPRTMTFRMDRSRERSLKHQTCRPKECASVNRKVACCSSKLHASHSHKRTHHRSRCLNRAWITEGMQPAIAGPKE